MNQLSPLRGSLFDELFRDPTPGYFVRPLHGDPLPQQIKLDAKEDPETYTLHAELPGVAKDDIHVTIEGPVVTISAELRQLDQQKRDERLLRSERYFGSVSRSVRLAVDVDEARATAKVDNGVLTLVLPKKLQSPGSRKLRID